MIGKILTVGFVALIVLIVYACCVVSKRADQHAEYLYNKMQEKDKK